MDLISVSSFLGRWGFLGMALDGLVAVGGFRFLGVEAAVVRRCFNESF